MREKREQQTDDLGALCATAGVRASVLSSCSSASHDGTCDTGGS